MLGVMTEMTEPGFPLLWHAALFHRDAVEFETRACMFAQDAARAGAAMLILGKASTLGGLRARLGGLAEHVTWLDAAEKGANPGRLISAISRFAREHSGRETWCVQQAAWPGRPVDELWEVLRHEALLNVALAGSRLRVLCPYDTRLPRELINCAETTHPVISPDGTFEPSPHYHGDIRGDVPEQCDRPLPAPPAGARVQRYADDLSPIRHLVWLEALAAGLPDNRADDLLIAVGELAANTLAHARPPGTLTMWATRAEVVCQVSDGGYIANPLAGRLRPSPAAPNGGRGLWLVHQLCDLVQIRTNPRGTTTRIHMRLPRS